MKRVVDHGLESFLEPLRVSPDELHLAAAIFCFVHRECDAAHACQRGDAVELRCESCEVSRTYAVSELNFVPPIEMRPLFRKPARRGSPSNRHPLSVPLSPPCATIPL